jgi:glycosyltransferase involved in cell wall biosynthesis
MNSLYQWMVAKANSHWEQQTLQNAERIISVSDKIRSEVLDLGIPPERVKTIHNGVDLNTFHPGTADRENLGLPADVPLAFFAGDIQSSRKNLDTVLRALRETPSTHLAVAGRLPGSPYPALAEKVGVDDRVHFLGFRSDVADLMRAADFFVFPSRYEACTLVLLEAMASGLPVVTASTTGGSELVTEKNGFVVQDPEDVARLTEHIRTLSEDCSLREDMGERSRTIANRHSWKRMSEEYLSAINTHT